MAVVWFEALVDEEELVRLADYDHHTFRLEHRAAVLITYLDDSKRRGSTERPFVLAVQHEAADRHPPLPEWLAELVQGLRWRPSTPPTAI